MAVQNFPFDSLSADNPDRAANSKIFADYLKSFFSDGIFPVLTQFPDMHQLAVRASNPAGMSVVVDTGMGLISGRQYAQDAERTLQIPAADTSLPRKDRIVLRMDLNTQYRNNELYVMTGTAASSPQPPALTRNNVVYELALATISVAANATSITAADITDERANTDVCGYVTNVLGQVDTSVINAQFQAFFEQTQENTADWEDAQQAAFTAWFDTIKGQLGEDAAGNLQNQIGVLSNLTTSEKSNLVDAINEVNAKEPDVLDTMEEIDANTDAGKVAGALAVKELSSDINTMLPSYTNLELVYEKVNNTDNTAEEEFEIPESGWYSVYGIGNVQGSSNMIFITRISVGETPVAGLNASKGVSAGYTVPVYATTLYFPKGLLVTIATRNGITQLYKIG